MRLLNRPWAASTSLGDVSTLGPADCFLAEVTKGKDRLPKHVPLLSWKDGSQSREIILLPYPKSGASGGSPVVHGLPARPKIGLDPQSQDEIIAADALARMNHVIARIQELDAALDDPEKVWVLLAEAWRRAEDEANPRMAEIVRQARGVLPLLQDLEKRIRRVLRRNREMTSLDRVQEMDRGSMLWLVRQPGRTTAERAGAGQRILATMRHENFDTLENRVLHAYVILAVQVSREWLREHEKASSSERFVLVGKFRKYCKRFASELVGLGVGVAPHFVTPNYVLMDDRAYRKVRIALERLLHRERVIDDLWAWQAQGWTDFCVLAVTLSLHALEDSELIAQSPILWRGEAVTGRWFSQDNPLAVFWLKDSGRIVEVQSRPRDISPQQKVTKAHVWLRISDLNNNDAARRVPVWTPHCFTAHDPQAEAEAALLTLIAAQRVPATNIMREGLVLMQAHGHPSDYDARNGNCLVRGIAFDATGAALAHGVRQLGVFLRGALSKESA